jgi:hypothetical protein
VGDVPVAVLVSAIERFEHSLALWARGQVWHSLVVRPSVQRSRTSKSSDLSSSSPSPSQSERLLVQGEQNRRGAFASHAGTQFSVVQGAKFATEISRMQKLGVEEERTLQAKPGVWES